MVQNSGYSVTLSILAARGANWMMALVIGVCVASTGYGAEPPTLVPSSTVAPTPIAESKQIQALNQRVVIFVVSKDRKGLIQADLESGGATFAAVGYNTVLLNAGSRDKAQLIARANIELAASRTVVLDSDGSEAEMAIVLAVAQAVCGGGAKAVALSITQLQEGVMAVTPLETDAAYQRRHSAAGKPVSAGNTARNVFGIN